MARIEIVPATADHIRQILPDVRQADIDEFAAFSGQTAEQVLTDGLRFSTRCWAGLADGKAFAIFGVAPGSILGGIGVPWLVSTYHVETHQKAFLRRNKPIIREMLDIYPTLENYVDERNHVAKIWLHWMGFCLQPAAPAGLMNMPFHHFTMRKE